MKSVLISIQPKWCELIASGKKTVEVRKTKPKLDVPFKCYIYCTMPKNKHDNLVLTPFGYDVGSEAAYCNYAGNSNGKVIGEFVCDKIITAEEGCYVNIPRVESQIDALDLMDYADGKTVYGWHISDLVIYDKPRELREFVFTSTVHTNCFGKHTKQVKRPPQSWCYVESEDTE